MGGAEAVEEVQEGHASTQRGRVGHQRQVVGLLHGAAGEHRAAGAARGHHVAVIAEDGERVGGDSPGSHVHHAGEQLARDLEEIRDHEQEPLGGGEGGAERALQQRAVDRAGSTRLALHLDHLGDGAPEVRLRLGAPHVGELAHG